MLPRLPPMTGENMCNKELFVCMDNDYQSKGYLCYNYGHQVGIKRISPYQESYTVNSHWKIYNDIISDVSACVRF